MFCTKCGTENIEDSVYCRKCGTLLEEEQETRIAAERHSAPGEKAENVVFSISPTLLFVKAGYGLAIVGSFLIVAMLSLFFPAVSFWVVIPLGLALLLIPAFYHLRKRMVRYTLTESTVEIDEGLISRTTRSIPIRRIQDVTVSAGFGQRLLGFGDIVIDNAGRDGERITLKNVNGPRKCADMLLRQMRQLEK